VKILHVIDTLSLGGAERICITTANLFSSKGYDVTVLELLKVGPLGKFLKPQVKTICLHRKSKFNIKTIYDLSEILDRYDVIHVHMRHVYRYVYLANFLSKRTLILHDHFNKFSQQQISNLIYYKLLSGHIYVSVNEAGVNWAIQNIGLQVDRVFKVINVIDKVERRNDIRNKNFVLVSNIKREKNIDFLIPLAKEIFEQDGGVQIDVIGKVMDEQYFEEISNQLTNLKLQDRVRFLKDVDAVQEIVGGYAIGLHFSKKESGPLVLLEYLAQNVPFVSYRTGEISDQIFKTLPMFFMNDFDAKAWRHRIFDLVTGRILYSSLEGVFEAINDTDNYFSQWLKIYKKSISL